MYFYHGNKHYYLAQVFLHDNELQDLLYANGLTGDFDFFAYTLAESLTSTTYSEDFLKNNSLSANEYYDQEYAIYKGNKSYVSNFLLAIQSAINTVYTKIYYWYMAGNKGLYVAILKSILYGSIKHFFFENRDKYLPQYDWYLINSNEKRKDIMEVLFREFDKLATICDSLKYCQDPDDIPLEFLIYLQEITGLTVNNYDGTFTSDQLRSLTKHLVDVWREKGALFSIELFFASMGITCEVKELWFDRRLYYNPDNFNNYTKAQAVSSFGYYLTPNQPHITSYEFSSESVEYSSYTAPRPSRTWEYLTDQKGDSIIPQLLGYNENNTTGVATYTYFKSNYILLNFSYPGQNKIVSKDELEIYKELVNHMLPAFVRTYYGNEYEDTYGNDDWDIFNGVDDSKSLTDKDGKTREATPLGLVDGQGVKVDKEKDGWVYDAYPADVAGSSFVSGSYINIYDFRVSQYIEVTGETNLEELISSGRYDIIGGVPSIKEHELPVYYDDAKHNYRYVGEVLTRDDDATGKIEIEETADQTDPRGGNLTRYFFKDNASDQRTRIYPYLLADNNLGSIVKVNQGCLFKEGPEDYDQELFGIVFGPQVDWKNVDGNSQETFDQKYTEQALNLFEVSSYYDEHFAVNDLYDDSGSWNGNIQYEYSQYSNPLEYLDSNLEKELTITLI